MKMTVQEVLNKVRDIDCAINTVEKMLPNDCFTGQEPLCDVIELLTEYREKILDSKVDI